MGRCRSARAGARLQSPTCFDHAHLRCGLRRHRSDRGQAEGCHRGKCIVRAIGGIVGRGTAAYVASVRASSCLTALAVFLSAPGLMAGAASAHDCTTEAQVLGKAQSELPSLNVASPQDRPPYCITLETIMAFTSRVKAHVAHCPDSDYAAAIPDWLKRQSDSSKLF